MCCIQIEMFILQMYGRVALGPSNVECCTRITETEYRTRNSGLKQGIDIHHDSFLYL